MTIMRKKRTYKEQTSGYQFREKNGEGNEQVQTIRYKINYKDMSDNMWNTGNIL